MKNLLIKADNLDGLRYLLNKKDMRGKIDLVYIDPPFATNSDLNLTGKNTTKRNSNKSLVAYAKKALSSDFVEFIRERLVLIRELLSDRGSIYLHTDCKTGPYLRIVMDEIFGVDNFRNDITRVKCNPKNFKRIGYGNIKDMILFYTKSDNAIWHEPKIPYSDEDIKKLFPKIDKRGRRYTTMPIHAPGKVKNTKPFHGMMPPAGRHWRTDIETMEKWNRDGLIEWSQNGIPRKIVFADGREGKRIQDIWTEFKDPLYPEYPTEKDINMIDLIVRTSSEKDSIVLDCFCGSGTTLEAAAKNGRTWIGIDNSDQAIDITKKRMQIDGGSFFCDDAECIEL